MLVADGRNHPGCALSRLPLPGVVTSASPVWVLPAKHRYRARKAGRFPDESTARACLSSLRCTGWAKEPGCREVSNERTRRHACRSGGRERRLDPGGGRRRDDSRVRAGQGTATLVRAGWWPSWRARFGLAEVIGTVAAIGGFAFGYLAAGVAAGRRRLATLCEMAGFYGCIGVRTAAVAWSVTAHLAGWRRLIAGICHAITQQLASCAAAEAMDALAVRPACLFGAAWLARPLPAGVWLGFAVGKAAADVAWYGTEAFVRRGAARSLPAMRSTPGCWHASTRQDAGSKPRRGRRSMRSFGLARTHLKCSSLTRLMDGGDCPRAG